MKKILLFLIVLLFGLNQINAQVGNYRAGQGALVKQTSADFNVAVGDSTLTKVTSSSFNTAIGYLAGANITTSYSTEATYLGFNAGYNNTYGGDNTFIGFLAGYYNTTSSDNTFIGNAAGFNNTQGDDNTFLGEGAGARNTIGDDNTYIGHKAGGGTNTSIYADRDGNPISNFGNATGSDNTALGSYALYSIISGYRNTAIGNKAGYDLEDGAYNTFVGDSTGVDVGKGRFNTFVGQAAGAATEHASGSTFIGFRAGWDNNRTNNDNSVDGVENTYLGYRTGHKNREGAYNVLLGARADFASVGYDNNFYNVGLGYGAIIGGINQEGRNNGIAIGAYSRINANNSIAIGYKAVADSTYTMVLGGINDGVADNRVTVGIGTKAPNKKATLDLADTDKGFLVNRLDSSQRTTLGGTLVAADAGMMVYDTDNKTLYTWDGAAWSSSTLGNLEARVTALESKADSSVSDKTPELFNYQTALLNTDNEPLSNTTVSFRISILQDTTTGNVVYQETHSATTNAKGLTSFKIGNGTVVNGDFSSIDWAGNTHFLKVEADTTGGTTYQDFGTSQLVSVPYALHAKTADRLTSGTSAKIAKKVTNSVKEESTKEIEALKNEVKELKAIVNKLLKERK